MPQAVALRAGGPEADTLFSNNADAVLGGELRFRGTAAITGSEAILCSKLLRRDSASTGASSGLEADC